MGSAQDMTFVQLCEKHFTIYITLPSTEIHGCPLQNSSLKILLQEMYGIGLPVAPVLPSAPF